jgi:hypothetical protein
MRNIVANPLEFLYILRTEDLETTTVNNGLASQQAHKEVVTRVDEGRSPVPLALEG